MEIALSLPSDSAALESIGTLSQVVRDEFTEQILSIVRGVGRESSQPTRVPAPKENMKQKNVAIAGVERRRARKEANLMKWRSMKATKVVEDSEKSTLSPFSHDLFVEKEIHLSAGWGEEDRVQGYSTVKTFNLLFSPPPPVPPLPTLSNKVRRREPCAITARKFVVPISAPSSSHQPFNPVIGKATNALEAIRASIIRKIARSDTTTSVSFQQTWMESSPQGNSRFQFNSLKVDSSDSEVVSQDKKSGFPSLDVDTKTVVINEDIAPASHVAVTIPQSLSEKFGVSVPMAHRGTDWDGEKTVKRKRGQDRESTSGDEHNIGITGKEHSPFDYSAFSNGLKGNFARGIGALVEDTSSTILDPKIRGGNLRDRIASNPYFAAPPTSVPSMNVKVGNMEERKADDAPKYSGEKRGKDRSFVFSSISEKGKWKKGAI